MPLPMGPRLVVRSSCVAFFLMVFFSDVLPCRHFRAVQAISFCRCAWFWRLAGKPIQKANQKDLRGMLTSLRLSRLTLGQLSMSRLRQVKWKAAALPPVAFLSAPADGPSRAHPWMFHRGGRRWRYSGNDDSTSAIIDWSANGTCSFRTCVQLDAFRSLQSASRRAFPMRSISRSRRTFWSKMPALITFGRFGAPKRGLYLFASGTPPTTSRFRKRRRSPHSS
mmetsp:Transcript_33899/g.80467  ORF Transcript_33899/g.80467 Transcript_33899/m.80467 type:complete len:223 (+) Transcript_33899:938-1606(+)